MVIFWRFSHSESLITWSCSAASQQFAGCPGLQCMMSGLALGTAVLYADLYFILKTPEVLEAGEAKTERREQGGGRAPVISPSGT